MFGPNRLDWNPLRWSVRRACGRKSRRRSMSRSEKAWTASGSTARSVEAMPKGGGWTLGQPYLFVQSRRHGNRGRKQRFWSRLEVGRERRIYDQIARAWNRFGVWKGGPDGRLSDAQEVRTAWEGVSL